ncbi:MAG: hypothetical protein M1839_003031 [Geoglossum umbratile]|nr:MAG: hypothetical protein M1839_003031 [Geoglossum umbratile]
MTLLSIFLLSIYTAGILASNTLEGYEQCTDVQKSAINNAYAQAKQIMDVVRDVNIDWNSVQAVEFLGPPGFNQNLQTVIQGEQAVIQGIIHGVANVNGGSIHPELKINVRCDDWDKGCDGNTIAYTTQRGPPKYDSGVINFCKLFFGRKSLDEVVESGRKEYNWQKKYDLTTYENQAITLIHELFHIDWVSNAGRWGPNLPVIDMRIDFYDPDDHGKKKTRDVYGPRNAKILARWNDDTSSPQPGRIVARSAENLALYTLAVYVTQQLGAYPHLPIVNTQPNHEPNFKDNQPFTIDSQGHVWMNASFPDELVRYGGDNETVAVRQFLDDSVYPKSYLDEWHHWANPLTQSSNFVRLPNAQYSLFNANRSFITEKHNQLHDGTINVATMVQSTWSNHTVDSKADGSYTSVFDGWLKYISSSCPNTETNFMWPASYGDVYLKPDGYLHDGQSKLKPPVHN